jgi:hypothetical protein
MIDDIAFAYYCIDLEDGGNALTEDFITMNKYFSKYRLKPNPVKRGVSRTKIQERPCYKNNLYS